MLGVILALAAVMAGLIAVFVGLKVRAGERRKLYRAAERIVKEDFLDYSLMNQQNTTAAQPSGHRVMVGLKALGEKPRAEYVFDPGKVVMIGRLRGECAICLADVTVSQRHARILRNDGSIWLQDLNSANGSVVRRGLFGRHKVAGGEVFKLRGGDVLCCGAARFKLKIFVYDMTMM